MNNMTVSSSTLTDTSSGLTVPDTHRPVSTTEKTARTFSRMDRKLMYFSSKLSEDLVPVLKIIAEKYCPSVLPVTKGKVRILDFFNPLDFTAEARSDCGTMTVRRHSEKWYVCFWSAGCRIISEGTLREDKRNNSFEEDLASEFFCNLSQVAQADIERKFGAFTQSGKPVVRDESEETNGCHRNCANCGKGQGEGKK